MNITTNSDSSADYNIICLNKGINVENYLLSDANKAFVPGVTWAHSNIFWLRANRLLVGPTESVIGIAIHAEVLIAGRR